MPILFLLFCIVFPFGFARVTFSSATLLVLLVLGKSTRPSFPQYTAVRLHFASVLFLPSRAFLSAVPPQLSIIVPTWLAQLWTRFFIARPSCI